MSKSSFFFKTLLVLSLIAQFTFLVSPLSLVLAKPRATLPPLDIEPTSIPTPLSSSTPNPSTLPTLAPLPTLTPIPTIPPDGGGSPLPYPDVSFLYDGNGVRVAKIVNGLVTLYVGGLEKNLATGETVKYYNFGSRNIGYKSSVDNQVKYVVTDQIASIKIAVNSQGQVLSRASYYPYGTLRESQGALPSRQYTSQINDTETNLYFYNARYYNPHTGTFLTADKAEGPNRYAYVGGNPILRNDPSGMLADAGGAEGGFGSDVPYDPGECITIFCRIGGLVADLRQSNIDSARERYPETFQQMIKYGADESTAAFLANPISIGGMSGSMKIVGGVSKNVVMSFMQKMLSKIKGNKEIVKEGEIFVNQNPYSFLESKGVNYETKLALRNLFYGNNGIVLESPGGVLIEKNIYVANADHYQIIKAVLDNPNYAYLVGQDEYVLFVLNLHEVAGFKFTSLAIRYHKNYGQYKMPSPTEIRHLLHVLKPDYFNPPTLGNSGNYMVNPFK